MFRVAVVVLVVLGLCVLVVPATSAAPMIFAHQGRLLDDVGQPISGSVDLTFTLYDASSDGSPLWSETHLAVPVAEGLFAVVLGSITPISPDLFASPPNSGVATTDLFLEIGVNGSPLSPRTQIISTPYSAVAIRVDGDLQTSPGSLSIDYRDPDDDGDGILTSDLLDSALFYISEGNGFGDINAFQYKVYQPGQPVYGNITFQHSSGGQTDTSYQFSSRANVTVEKFQFKESFGQVRSSRQGVTDTSSVVDVSSTEGDVTSSARMEAIIGRNVLKSFYETGDKPTQGQFLSTSDTASVSVSYNSGQSAVEGTATEESAMVAQVRDLDRDGIPEVVVSSFARDDSSGTTFDGTDESGRRVRGGGLILHETVGTSRAVNYLDSDDDNDGIPEASASTSVSTDSSTHQLDVDSDDDGISDIEVRLSTTKQVSKVVVRGWDMRSSVHADSLSSGSESSLDSNGDSNPEASITSLVTADSSTHTIDLDSDDDGIPESESELRVLSHEAAHIVQQRAGVGVDRLISTVETSADTGGASLELRTNVGINESIPDTKLHLSVSSSSVLQRSGVDVNKDGVPDVVMAQACSPDSAVHEVSLSFENAMLLPALMKAKEKANKTKCSRTLSSDGPNGVSESEISCDTAATASFVQSSTGSSPDQGTTIFSQLCTADSVVKEMTFAYPDTTTPTYIMKAKEKANKTKCSNNLRQLGGLSRTETETSCDSVSALSTWTADDFGGSITSVTIQASTDAAINPIEHSSGAHLTNGGVWTNASDASLKENFQPVDGEQLLEKLESLDISEWNYIVEDDAVKHIGPTAQDFQNTFGVGSDGKSISTIDPAGIALAAIKALNEKSKRVDQLEVEVAQLKSLVEQLLDEKK